MSFQTNFLVLLSLITIVSSSHFTHTSKTLSFPLQRSTYYNKPLANLENIQYQTLLSFGKPYKVFPVIIDTGSADLFLPSTENSVCSDVNTHLIAKNQEEIPLYNCSNSETCIETDEEYLLSYDDGEISTIMAFDRVLVSPGLKVYNQSFLLAEDITGNFECTGLWGLGFPDLAMNRNPGILQNLYKDQAIESYLFGLYLNSGESSQLILGGIDESLMDNSSNIAYFPFLSTDSYEIEIGSLSVGDKTIELTVNTALPDSGNSELTLPKSISDQFLDYFNENLNLGCYYFIEESAPDYSLILCEVTTNSSKFPNITLSFGEESIEMEAEDYIDACEIQSNGSAICTLTLEMSLIDDEIILGDAFLQSFYSIFDLENKKLGLARNVNRRSIGVSVSLLQEESIVLKGNSGRQFDWKVYVGITGLLMVLPLVGLSSYFMRRNKVINEGENYTILGVTFLVVIIGINLFITLIN